MTMDVMKRKISEHAGDSSVEFVTDEDGDVKGVYDWLGSGSSGGGGDGNTEVRVGTTEEPAARQLRRRDGVQRGSVVAVAMEVAAAPPPGSPQRRVGGPTPGLQLPLKPRPREIARDGGLKSGPKEAPVAAGTSTDVGTLRPLRPRRLALRALVSAAACKFACRFA